jgi:NADPH:quinone reductase-like Zn-dependent oxidoreductase
VRVVRLYADGLRMEEVERPVPREGEVLVKVHAAAITRGELAWAAGRLPAVPSYELSGVIVDTGEEVFALTPFDRDGVAADYASVPSAVLAPKPASGSRRSATAWPATHSGSSPSTGATQTGYATSRLIHASASTPDSGGAPEQPTSSAPTIRRNVDKFSARTAAGAPSASAPRTR